MEKESNEAKLIPDHPDLEFFPLCSSIKVHSVVLEFKSKFYKRLWYSIINPFLYLFIGKMKF